MPKIQLTERFQKSYASLPYMIQDKAKNKLRLLAENPSYPSLQTKPVEGAPGIYEARVDRNYRLTYERLPGDILLLRVIGAHDETLKNP